ncbi:MAG: phosphatase PAP2 family protein [Eubacterium sp.]
MCIKAVNLLSTIGVYWLFLFNIIFMELIIKKNKVVYKSLIVAGISFVLVSLVRKMINADRPYTKYDFVPLIEKNKTGESMPSRHVFSAFVIGVTVIPINPIISVVCIICGVFIAITRVALGVHFIRDVIAGALIGIICGTIVLFI